jgi:hypothetical protein
MKMKLIILTLTALLAAVLTALSRRAESGGSYDLIRCTFAGGDGTNTSGPHSVTGTVGQPGASRSSGGSYTADGAFWGIIAVVQTPDVLVTLQ